MIAHIFTTFMWPRAFIFPSVLNDLLSRPLLCLYIFHSFASSTAESPAVAAENTNVCETAQTHAHAHALVEQKWLQEKPGMGPRLRSQAAWLLIIAIGFESPLKQPRACVHVFKKQCYVSACHLEAFALQFSPALAPFLSPVLSGIKVALRGAQWPRPGQILCVTVGDCSHSGEKKKCAG